MLTTKEVGQKLFVCTESVRSYIRSGQLKAIRIAKGKKFEYRISNEAIEDFKRKYQNIEKSNLNTLPECDINDGKDWKLLTMEDFINEKSNKKTT
jgi:hypothetical protein